jgi:ribosomal protein S18 acetylase RimI-like enzyme
MFNGYSIRVARRKDIHHLPYVERDAVRRFAVFGLDEMTGATIPLELLEQRQSCGQLWVALRDDKPVGFAVASVLDDNGHIDELDVSVQHGRRGLGSRLVKKVCNWAFRSGLKGVTLSTLRTIPWNAPFYVKLGFDVMREEDLTEGLQRLRQLEALAGLPVSQRVIMRRRF